MGKPEQGEKHTPTISGRWKGSLRMRSSVDFWQWRISRSAMVWDLKLEAWSNEAPWPPAAAWNGRENADTSCLRGSSCLQEFAEEISQHPRSQVELPRNIVRCSLRFDRHHHYFFFTAAVITVVVLKFWHCAPLLTQYSLYRLQSVRLVRLHSRGSRKQGWVTLLSSWLLTMGNYGFIPEDQLTLCWTEARHPSRHWEPIVENSNAAGLNIQSSSQCKDWRDCATGWIQLSERNCRIKYVILQEVIGTGL